MITLTHEPTLSASRFCSAITMPAPNTGPNNVPTPLAWNSSNAANRSDALAVVFQDFNLNAFTHLLAEGTNVLALQVINAGTGSSDLLLMNELQLTWPISTGAVSLVAGYLYPATPGSARLDILGRRGAPSP